MKHQLLSLGAALSLVAASASPAFAFFWGGTTNNAVIDSNITTTAITGMNTQGNSISVKKAGADDLGVSGNNNMTTGAATASTKSLIAANINLGMPASHLTNNAMIGNMVLTQVDTGDNSQGNGVTVYKAHVDDVTVSGSNTMVTGAANAKTKSMVIVNAQWSGMMP